MITRRFVGGPLHGEIRALQNHHDFHVALPPKFRVPLSDALKADSYDECARIQRMVYTERPIGLGPWAKVVVMAPEGMQESEFMRRVADLIEGVGGK